MPVEIPWIHINGWYDPPKPPPGFRLEAIRDSFLGIISAYRFVPVINLDAEARNHVEGAQNGLDD